MKTIESISGCLRVALTVLGGMTVTLAPVCDSGLQPTDFPAGALCDVHGIPFITSDGYYLIVANS